MSAETWVVCPKCVATAREKREQLADRAAEAYGTRSQEDFLELLEKSKQKFSEEYKLREDWEIGIWPDGRFMIKYIAHCSRCSFGYEFRCTRNVLELHAEEVDEDC